jgi:hypothetical protein
MKIKRFENLWLMGLILSAVILGVIYILKIFAPNFVIEVAQIDSITRIGHYIDTHKWAWYLASFCLSFISYYLMCGACCKKKTLNNKEILIIISIILFLYFSKEFLPKQYTNLNICFMVVTPCILKADFKATTVHFLSSNLLQTVTLEIRGLQLMISNFNYATLIILMIDGYILELLLYFMYNYKTEKEKKSYGYS